MKPKLPGQQSELQELDVEDKRRIEELKRELLLKYPTMVIETSVTVSSLHL